MALTAATVHHQLRRAARRLRWSRFARCLLTGFAASLALLLVFLSCDAWLHLGRAARWTGLLLFVLPAIAGAVASWRAARPAISEAAMARRLERAAPGARNELINAVLFDRELAKDSPLRAALFGEMNNPFPRVDWTRVLDLKLLKRVALALVAAVALLGAWALAKPKHFNNALSRVLLPASDIEPLTRTRIDRVEPGNAQVVRDGKLVVSAELTGDVPAGVWLHYRETGGGWQRALMGREIGASTFTHEGPGIRQATQYYVAAGDTRSSVYQLGVRARTAVSARAFEIQPPAYTRLPKSSVKDTTVLSNIVPGSRITANLDFNGPLEELSVGDDTGAGVVVSKRAETRYQFSAVIDSNRTFKIRYCDPGLVYDTDTVRCLVKPDAPPTVTVQSPAEGSELKAAPTGSVTIRFTAGDDFGLADVALYRSTDDNPAAELIHDWREAAGERTFGRAAEVPLAKHAKEDRVTFCVVARDANDVAASPGLTTSRPVVVMLRSTEKLAEQAKEARRSAQRGLEDLVRLQEANLAGTRAAARADKAASPDFSPLVDRQAQIAELGKTLAGSDDQISLEARQAARELSGKEMPAAVTALRDAAASVEPARIEHLLRATQFESLILARLKGVAADAGGEENKAAARDAISGLEELNKRQRDLLAATKTAGAASAKELSDRQDDLSTRASQVKKELERTARDPAAGDADFRKRLADVAGQFGPLRIYEDMLAAAEKLQASDFTNAVATQQAVIAHVSKLIAILGEWQLAAAAREADHLREVAKNIAGQLEKLKGVRQQILAKSKEVARRDESRPEDAAMAREIRGLQDLLTAAVEKMLIDAEIFPDIPNANEVRSILAEIFEDVKQSDLDDIRNNKEKVQELAVQKEDWILKGFEAAQKKTEELEEWLPHTAETQKWLLENFDKTEFPNLPQTPLPEAYTDLVGKLLEKQKSIQDQLQDAASNQFLASAPVGWEVRDGPQGTLGGQGKSSNEAPNHNEQSGRSSGGREGMSNGEMNGDTASSLEGDKADARRTNDGFQAGHVKDDGKIGETRATGGGKSGRFSDRAGMEGNGPVRTVNAGGRAAANAAAVEQALLADKTSKTYAQASLLYLKADGLPEVARLMRESRGALQDGRIQDFKGINRKIIGRLGELKDGIDTQKGVVTLRTGDAARAADQRMISGTEGEAPALYKDAVTEYYRSLSQEK